MSGPRRGARAHRRSPYWGVVLALGCGTGEPGQEPRPVPADRSGVASHDWVIEPGVRVGPVDAASSEARLIEALGSERVVRREIYLAEGFCTDGTVLYPDSPDALDIAWMDSARTRPAFLRIDGEGSRWTTPAGVRIGTTLAELEAIRGDILTFSGFGWDYGGGTSWHETDETRGVGLRLSPDSVSWNSFPNDELWDEILGDRPVRSDHPFVRRLTIIVESIATSFGYPYEEHDCRTLRP